MKSIKIICMLLICCSFCGCAERKEDIDEYISVELGTEVLTEDELEDRKLAFTMTNIKNAIEEFSYDEINQVNVSYTASEEILLVNIQIIVTDNTDQDIKKDIQSAIEEYAKRCFSEDVLVTVDIE